MDANREILAHFDRLLIQLIWLAVLKVAAFVLVFVLLHAALAWF